MRENHPNEIAKELIEDVLKLLSNKNYPHRVMEYQKHLNELGVTETVRLAFESHQIEIKLYHYPSTFIKMNPKS